VAALVEGDRPAEECGVFGVFGDAEAARMAYYGLYALQHRGQESAGIATSSGGRLHLHRGMGLVADIFDDQVVAGLPGDRAIGHVRYSTTGRSDLSNAQPLLVRFKGSQMALAHNGNLCNACRLRADLEEEGSIFQTSSDTEVIAHLAARRRGDHLPSALVDSLRQVQGAYALVVLTPESLMAARDPAGIRPLCLGRRGPAWLVSSETCALDTVGAEFVRDVRPGELLIISSEGIRSMELSASPGTRPALCIFEFIYFARPDSDLLGENVHLVRKRLGRFLARDFPVEADVVTGVPDSSISAASGYAEEAGIAYQMGLVRNRYIGRTFIQPGEALRSLGVKLKLNPIHRVVAGQRVVLVDDSIVRGTTSKFIVQLLREVGAKEVHVRISSAPYRYSCYYGIDTSARGELIASDHSVEEIRRLIGADTLAYLSEERMIEAAGPVRDYGFCTACFSGSYPTAIDPQAGKSALEA